MLFCTALSSGGDLAAAAFPDASLRIWETVTGNEICRMNLGSEARRMTFLPDNRSLCIADGAGGVRCLDLSCYYSPKIKERNR
jgi:hypothetical protein